MLDFFKMTNKKQMLTLSYISFLSFILIGVVTTFLVVNATSFNLISDSLTCIQVISIAVAILTAITHTLNCRYSDSCQPQIQIVPIIKCILFMLLFCILFHFTTILFGAPVIEKSAETFHFAILMTVLVALPSCLASGPSLENWLDIYTGQSGASIETVVHFSTLGALIGAWFGAVPIPLDWDRPWQAWPITCCVGAISGYCGGLLLASLYLPHKFQQLNKSKRS